MRKWLMLIGIAAVPHLVEATVLCARRSGTLVIRPVACRSTEAVVDPVAVGLQGPAGPQGPQGPAGPEGPAGSPQTLDVQTVVSQRAAGPGLAQTDAACPPGYALTGGGAGTGDGASELIDSSPNVSLPATWAVIYYNPPGGAVNVSFAVCARLQ